MAETSGLTVPSCSRPLKTGIFIFLLIDHVLIIGYYLRYYNAPSIIRTGKASSISSTDDQTLRNLFTYIDLKVQERTSTEINPRNIAIGLGITTRGPQRKNVTSYPFFSIFLQSFCNTSSDGYNYYFYLAYDDIDPQLKNTDFVDKWKQYFRELTEEICPKTSNYSISMIRCSHSRRPAWAQNDAMMEAYLDDNAYFYRVNDDTRLVTEGWTEAFIPLLGQFDPPNVGVVGPLHDGGNAEILTHDFVHLTHINIFGLYYPRVFKSWYADDWITYVYTPERRNKMADYRVEHTMGDGRRYEAPRNGDENLNAATEAGQHLITQYIESVRENTTVADGRNIISMGLWGDKMEYTWGAIRNAQLIPIHFPQWKLRVYITDRNTSLKVPDKITHKLHMLGAQVVKVGNVSDVLPPDRWRLLVVTDPEVTHFLIRNANGQLSRRDAVLVGDWLKSGKPFHCIRDHADHMTTAVVDGLWGAMPNNISADIWREMLQANPNATRITMKMLLNSYMWPRVVLESYCHDSVSCDYWPLAVKFPHRENDYMYIGESIPPFVVPLANDTDLYKIKYNDYCYNDTVPSY